MEESEQPSHEQSPSLAPPAGEATVDPPIPVTRSARMAAHGAVFLAGFGGFTNLYSTQALYPTLRDRFDMGAPMASSLLTATTLGLAFSAPFATRLTGRMGAKHAVLTGLAALTVLTLLFALVESSLAMVLIRVAQGAVIPVVLAALLASLASLAEEADAAELAATYTMATLVGGLAGRFVPAVLVGQEGRWFFAFMNFAGLQALILAAVWILFPAGTSARMAAVEAPPLRTWAASIPAMLTGNLLRVCVMGFCLLFSQVAVTTLAAVRLASEPYSWSPGEIGALYLVFVPALAAVRLTPALLQRFGERRLLRYALGAAWLGLAITTVSTPWIIVAGLTCFSAAVFAGQATLARATGRVAGSGNPTASGVYLCLLYLGGSAGALLPSLAWDSSGWLGGLLVVAGVQLAGLLLTEEDRDRTAARDVAN